jgi:hypothetical protein
MTQKMKQFFYNTLSGWTSFTPVPIYSYSSLPHRQTQNIVEGCPVIAGLSSAGLLSTECFRLSVVCSIKMGKALKVLKVLK